MSAERQDVESLARRIVTGSLTDAGGTKAIAEALLAPIPMRLVCEDCGVLHIDEGEFATKPHHTHACQFCGLVWRPAVVCTVGVQFLPGFKNDKEPSR